MIPCQLCCDGSNAEFVGYEIISDGQTEALLQKFVCKSCGYPTYVLLGVRAVDDTPDDNDDWKPADFLAGWEV